MGAKVDPAVSSGCHGARLDLSACGNAASLRGTVDAFAAVDLGRNNGSRRAGDKGITPL